MVVDFLANNYIWFLVITIILCLSLIGYIVDLKEQKKWNNFGNYSKDTEQNFEKLAALAQNKTLTEVVKTSEINPMNQNNISNQIQHQTSNNSMVMPALNNNSNSTSFQVLGK